MPHDVRAPKDDGAVVAEPPLAAAPDLIRSNANLLSQSSFPILGRPARELIGPARDAMLTAAGDYLRRCGEDAVTGRAAIVMAGHQPELFHPGVWVKNFALQGIAHRQGACLAVNLVVDNDAVKSTVLHYPATNGEAPYRATEPFDAPAAGEPYEERTVHDEALFAGLPQRVRVAWPYQPLLREFWGGALKVAARTTLLGERLAAGRRAIERRWGCHNLEVPVSAVCRTDPYAWFACDLLANLPRLHAAYNESVRDYRRRYGLRSTSHPVPDLAAEGDWLEAPLWAWRAGQVRRNRLMVRPTPAAVELRAGDEPWPSLPREPEAMVRAFLDLGRQGLKVRSRALTNTMYARLFLCDLFLHGIGGGKYDEVTDAIIRRHYGVEPPAYLVLSATLLLPLPHSPATPDDCRRLRCEARDLFYNPQRHLDGPRHTFVDSALVARKEALIREQPADRRGRRERFREIREVSERLRASINGKLAVARQGEAACDAALRANAILMRRDYSFVLYPEETLRPFCEQFLATDASAKRR
jgi:hypothetical protein